MCDRHVRRRGEHVTEHRVLHRRHAFREPCLEARFADHADDMAPLDDDQMMNPATTHGPLGAFQRLARPHGFDVRAHDVFEAHTALDSCMASLR
jgi:hypothetical protein